MPISVFPFFTTQQPKLSRLADTNFVLYRLFIALIVVVLCTGNTHHHQWADATCIAPKTCTECGKTEGVALGHTPGEWEQEAPDYVAAEVRMCQRCTTCGAMLDSKREMLSTLCDNGEFLLTPDEFSKRYGEQLGDIVNPNAMSSPISTFLHTFFALAIPLSGSRYFAPHSVQNVCPSPICAPHFTHTLFFAVSLSAPHFGQNRCPSFSGSPHFRQTTLVLLACSCTVYTPSASFFSVFFCVFMTTALIMKKTPRAALSTAHTFRTTPPSATKPKNAPIR